MDMTKKLTQCPKCGENSFVVVEKGQSLETVKFQQISEKLKSILKSRKGAYEKRIALFNWLKTLKVGDLEPTEQDRINSLLLSKLYNELAKQSIKEYKKLTVKDFSQDKTTK